MFSFIKLPVVLCGLLFCLLMVVNCEKGTPIENTIDDESIQCEKDGVITILMYQNITDTTEINVEYQPPQPSDSFFVSEEDHKMVIQNAVPVSIPKMNNVTYFFKGDFEGMENEIIIWTDYTYTSMSGRRKRELLADRIEDNHAVTYLMRTDLDDTDPARAFVFCLDKDNNNTGTGRLIISNENYADTVCVDAEKNTVCYPPPFDSLNVEFEDRGFQRNLQFECPDRESFVISNDGIIYFFTSDLSDKILQIGTSYSFAGISVEDLKIRLNMYAFVPQFLNRKE